QGGGGALGVAQREGHAGGGGDRNLSVRLKAGGWRLEAGGWRLEAGGWRLESVRPNAMSPLGFFVQPSSPALLSAFTASTASATGPAHWRRPAGHARRKRPVRHPPVPARADR